MRRSDDAMTETKPVLQAAQNANNGKIIWEWNEASLVQSI